MPSHKRDWKQYNKQLINRGNLNFWVTKKLSNFGWQRRAKKTVVPLPTAMKRSKRC